ncbi:MAG TPA: DUF3040 domain-containing protein [Jatrophihabitans sp.]|nr:DUF3040 domain-containing protein [Jatrophihabitans sp.]
MTLSEHELRVLRSLEDSLSDCERRCAAVERRVRDGGRRLWLLTLLFAAIITGVDFVLLGVIIGDGGIGLTFAGLAILAVGVGRLGVVLHRRLRERAASADPSG